MKIAIVIEKFQPGAGGNERSTQQIARRLVERGHEVTVLANRAEPAADVLLGGRVVCAQGLNTKHAVGLWRFIRWTQRRLDEGGYDISMSMMTAVPATVVQPRGGTVRETLARNVAMRPSASRQAIKKLTLVTSPKQLALLAAERRTLHHPRVRKIVAISRYVADQLRHHYGVTDDRIELIPNAAEVTRVDPASRGEVRGRARERMGLRDEDVMFLFAARNPGLKGVGSLLEAMAKVHRERPRAKLVVAGTHRHGLHRRIGELGLRDAVRWIGPTREIDTLYTAADVTVLPSWYDPSSKVVLESLLHGVPAISTLYNGASQWILNPGGGDGGGNEGGDGESARMPSPFDPAAPRGVIQAAEQPAGRVIDSPRNVDALAAAMNDLCDDAERQRCAAATAGLQEHITMDRHVDRLEALLVELA